MKKTIEIKHRGVSVKIFPTGTVKNGPAYRSFQVADYSNGERKLWTFADLEHAQIYPYAGTVAVSHSVVEHLGAFAGNGNAFFDPLFKDAGNEIPPKFERLSYADAMERFGSDRPDSGCHVPRL